MSFKEKLPKLVDVYRSSYSLTRRQLPLMIDENLTLVMDLKHSGLVCDNPLIGGKELEEFKRKCDILTVEELNSALQISKSELSDVLNQNVPCVGCRRGVERLYYQLFKLGLPTLDPLTINSDGIITIKDEKQFVPQLLCSIFHNHSIRLAKLIENQPKRSKRSHRCFLHSMDSHRYRPLTSVWRDVWSCMHQDCKKDVCIIEATTLFSTLETYLRKHRFCGECRTKVLKAYTLLVEESEPCKEKGYVKSLYAGIKRCLPDKHIHLPTNTEYITKLISRAEPELLGSRRERHAKTLEIAQEEVLTCLGICMHERLHRIYMRIREEECTCKLFAAVAVDTISRSFETAVEHKQGFSQLELLYAELTREEQQKQIRKNQKKLKRKRKKTKLAEHSGKENFNEYEDVRTDEEPTSKEEYCHCANNFECSNRDIFVSPIEASMLKCSEDENIKSCESCSNGPNNTDFTSDKLWTTDRCKCECENDIEENRNNCFKCSRYMASIQLSRIFDSLDDHPLDCDYYTNNNNVCYETDSLSNMSSSPEGSETNCNDTCCHDGADTSNFGDGNHLSLQRMLQVCNEEDDDGNCKLTPEEVWEFETNNKHLSEQRKQLREALKKRFIDFCTYGSLPVPHLLIHTKYGSN